ncbi:MAG TPA: hypothetical protein VFQ61_20790 [Polyangiaceae bacterium]|nr:hypothetical protein [Polyangiaceae bacterium]
MPEGWPPDGSSLEDYDVAGELCGNRILYGAPFSDEALFGLRGTVDGEPAAMEPSDQNLGDCSKPCVRLGVLADPIPDTADTPKARLRLQLAQLSVRLDSIGPWIATFQVGRPASKVTSDACKLLVSTTGPQPAQAEGTLVTTFVLAPDGMERGNAVAVLDATLAFPDPAFGLVSKQLHLELALPWTYRIATPRP